MRIAVIGASGFVGRFLVRFLADAGADVTVLDAADPLNSDAEALTYNQKESVLNPYFLVSA